MNALSTIDYSIVPGELSTSSDASQAKLANLVEMASYNFSFFSQPSVDFARNTLSLLDLNSSVSQILLL